MDELTELRQRIAALEASEVGWKRKVAGLEQATEALQDQTRILRSILDSIGEGVLVVDETGKFLIFNSAAEQIVGMSPEDTSLDRWLEKCGAFLPDTVTLLPYDKLPSVRAMCGEEVDEVEIFHRNPKVPDGVFVHATSRSLKDEEGNLKGAVVVVHDITRRKQMGEDLQKARDKLEHQVEERTAELKATNEQLREEIAERRRTVEELRMSRGQLRSLAAHLQSAIEQQRISIAREMHDELGQALTAATIDLTVMGRKITNNGKLVKPSYLLGEIAAVKGLLGATIKKMKLLITELRPEVLDNLGLMAALKWQLRTFQNQTGVECEFDSSLNEIELDPESSTAIYRIFQETLTNVARHANASRVAIKMDSTKDRILLEIADNGVGFSGDQLEDTNTFGLLGIKERALVFEGDVEITSAEGKGTTVKLRIPVH